MLVGFIMFPVGGMAAANSASASSGPVIPPLIIVGIVLWASGILEMVALNYCLGSLRANRLRSAVDRVNRRFSGRDVHFNVAHVMMGRRTVVPAIDVSWGGAPVAVGVMQYSASAPGQQAVYVQQQQQPFAYGAQPVAVAPYGQGVPPGYVQPVGQYVPPPAYNAEGQPAQPQYPAAAASASPAAAGALPGYGGAALAAGAAGAAMPPDPVKPGAEGTDEIVCRNCSSRVPAGNAFCGKCGAGVGR
jgi:hypothetical protein